MDDEMKKRNDELNEILREAREMRLSRTQELELFKKQQAAEQTGDFRIPSGANAAKNASAAPAQSEQRSPAPPAGYAAVQAHREAAEKAVSPALPAHKEAGMAQGNAAAAPSTPERVQFRYPQQETQNPPTVSAPAAQRPAARSTQEDDYSPIWEKVQKNRMSAPAASAPAAVPQKPADQPMKQENASAAAERLVQGAQEPAEKQQEAAAPQETALRAAQERVARTGELPAQKDPALAKRSVLGSLMGQKPVSDSMEFDPINKDMLAPKIGRGTDFVPEESVPKSKTQEIEVSDAATYAENHPLFTQTMPTPPVLIPKEDKAELHKQAAKAERSAQIAQTAVFNELGSRQTAKKSVLNVKENIDDNFREFFGDTVIIDRESLNEKAKRQRKIKDFIVADKEGEVGGPVFEDEEEEPQESGKVDYRSDEDTEPVLAQLTAQRGKKLFRLLFNTAFALLLLVLSAMAEFRLVQGALEQPNVFYLVNLAVFAVLVVLNAKTIFGGLGKLFTFRADGESLVSFACIAAVLELGSLLLFAGDDPVTGVCACAAAGALAFSALGDYLDAGRVLNSFRTVSESYEKYSTSTLEDKNVTRRLCRELEMNNPRVLIKRKTGFTDNFLQHAYSGTDADSSARRAASILLFVSLAAGALGFVKGGSPLAAMRYIAFTAAFTAPFVSTLTTRMPIFCMQQQLSKLGAVMPGYSAAQEVCDANCVVLEGRELFPKGNVMLHGIKTFEKERIDKAILYAASVLIQSCDTMSHVFMNVIQSKTEMLYPVDSVEYESGLGFSFWVDKTRVLLGTREMLKSHEIDVPSRDYENRYTKMSTRDAIYLAVAGKLYAMFVLSYAPNTEVEEALQAFEREGVSLLVHTRDFNITPEKISRLYRIPRKMISVVSESDMAELTKQTEYVSHAPSALTHIGSLTSFVKGIIACYNVRAAAKLSGSIELACMLLGGAAALVLGVAGLIPSIGALPIVFFQLICCLLLILVAALHRY